MNIQRIFRSITIFLLVFVSYSVIAQGIIICKQCAYEIPEGGKFCSHCGAAVDQTYAPAPTPSAPMSEPTIETQTQKRTNLAVQVADPFDEIVKQDLADALTLAKHPSGLHAGTALAILKNARAVIAIASPDSISEKNRTLVMKGITSTEAAIFRANRVCPRCEGKGTEVIMREYSQLDGETTTMAAGKRACPLCNGLKYIKRLRKTTEIKRIFSEGLQQFENRSLINGRVQIGNAWIPQDVVDTLTIQQKALLRHYTAAPCPKCMGVGKIDCPNKGCNNAGFTRCDEEGCKNGILRLNQRAINKLPESSVRFSQVSAGKTCPRCHGTNLIPCEICNRTGSIVCDECNGSGERDICSSCNGTGVSECRNCRGTGEKDGQPCPFCKGEKITLCSRCGGDGYDR